MSKTCEKMPVPRAFSNALIVKFAYYELSDNDWMNELYSQHILDYSLSETTNQ